MLFLAFIFKRGAGYGDPAILRSLITLRDPRRNLYAPIRGGSEVGSLNAPNNIIHRLQPFVNCKQCRYLQHQRFLAVIAEIPA